MHAQAPSHAGRSVAAHQREVGGAAANARHPHPLPGLQRGLVVQHRGDGLVLQVDVGEAGLARRLYQHRLGPGIALRIVVDEEHGVARHQARQSVAGIVLGRALLEGKFTLGEALAC